MDIHAPFSGIVRYHVGVGEAVSAGQVVATVEAVKLESPVVSPGAGIVSVVVAEDFSHVVGGELLATIAAGEEK